MTIRYSTLLLGLAAAFTGLSASAETKFTANSFYEAGAPLSKYGYIEWADKVKEVSKTLQPKTVIGTVLLAPRASLQGVQKGVAQVAAMPAMYTPSEMPLANAIQELGFIYDDSLAAILAVTDFSMSNPEQLAEWKKLNIVYLGAYATPPYVLMCRTPVRNLDEIKGKRIRTAGSAISDWVDSVGGIPVNIASSEMYTGLDRGTLDCASNAANDLIDRSLWEVAKDVTMLPTGIYFAGPHWGYNGKFWASLTPGQRGELMQATAYTLANMTINYLASVDKAIDEAKGKGVRFYDPDPGLKGTVDEYSKKVVASAYEAARKAGAKDPEQFIDDFRQTYEGWVKKLETVDRKDIQAVSDLAMKEIYARHDPKTYGVD